MREAALPRPRLVRLSGKRRAAAYGLVVAALLALDVWVTHTFLVARGPGTVDFYARWVGARAYFLQGLSPYSDQVSQQIQEHFYGRLARPGEDLVLFVYPLYTVFLIAPLALLPYTWAAAIWLVLLEFCLLAGLLIALDLYRWRPPPGVLAMMAVWTLLFYPHGRGLVLGQFVAVIFLSLALALWALVHGRDGLAGVVLALTTIKPQVAFLAILFMLVWAISRRRWRFVWAFVLALGILLAASFLALPGWLGDFVRQATTYPSYTTYPPYILTSVPWILTHLTFPALGTPGEVALILALLAGLAWAWWREARSGWASFHWTLGLTLAVSNLAGPRTTTTNYVVFLVPLVPLFHHVYRRAGALVLAGAQTALVLGLWVLFLARGVGVPADLMVFVSTPLFMLLALAWGQEALARPLDRGGAEGGYEFAGELPTDSGNGLNG